MTAAVAVTGSMKMWDCTGFDHGIVVLGDMNKCRISNSVRAVVGLYANVRERIPDDARGSLQQTVHWGLDEKTGCARKIVHPDETSLDTVEGADMKVTASGCVGEEYRIHVSPVGIRMHPMHLNRETDTQSEAASLESDVIELHELWNLCGYMCGPRHGRHQTSTAKTVLSEKDLHPSC
ncbi:hypothetical protein POX_f08174 [Penicillium oxalicum]|uniref:hypothetical protein n=1 Tax=Penicillium oxalicum TaxID=69781 RepID=UPI0020B6F5F8|nr:hypothetical protein POX_f08174 [Penicillium oxalicum]KAI2787797.1 hypothetical protein POX_f08174 [Penicillium oxalicum]